MTTRTLFIDLDGVLADFDTAYAAVNGSPPDKSIDNVDWRKVVSVPGFYAKMPALPGAADFWASLEALAESEGLDIVILTGCPSSVPAAAADKRSWVTKHLGEHVKMIACRSRDKKLHMKPGDILVDDWERYKEHWLEAGGIWITHTSPTESLAALKELTA